MSGTGIFIYGLAVTIVVGLAVAFLAYGAILDGRYDREMKERLRTGRPDDRFASAEEVMSSAGSRAD
jgi:hypothetical protein